MQSTWQHEQIRAPIPHRHEGVAGPVCAAVWAAGLRLLLGVALVLASVSRGTDILAQDISEAKAQECQKAAQVVWAFDQAAVRSGGVASQGSGKLEERSLAVGTLLGCGALGGRAAAATIRLTRTLSFSGGLTALVLPFRSFRDTAVISAALEVATDASASGDARVAALHTMWIVQTGKFWLGYDEMVPRPKSVDEWQLPRCGQGVQVAESAPYWEIGAEPAPGFGAELQAVAKRLRADPSQPAEVRAAALCVLIP